MLALWPGFPHCANALKYSVGYLCMLYNVHVVCTCGLSECKHGFDRKIEINMRKFTTVKRHYLPIIHMEDVSCIH